MFLRWGVAVGAMGTIIVGWLAVGMIPSLSPWSITSPRGGTITVAQAGEIVQQMTDGFGKIAVVSTSLTQLDQAFTTAGMQQ